MGDDFLISHKSCKGLNHRWNFGSSNRSWQGKGGLEIKGLERVEKKDFIKNKLKKFNN